MGSTSANRDRACSEGLSDGCPAYRGDYRGGLAQELGVEVVDEDLFDPRLREAVLAIHCDELTAYALQLRQGHGRCGQLDSLLHVLHLDLAPSLSFMVLLVCHYLGQDVGCRLVELVEVVLLRCGFLTWSVTVLSSSRDSKRTSTVAMFGLTTLVLPSLPTIASQI